LAGGTFVAARQGLSLVIGLLGTSALTRFLGPAEYGRFAAAWALYGYAFSVAPLGVPAWLVRRTGRHAADALAIDPGAATQARSVLLASALLVGGLLVAALPLLGSWMRVSGAGLLVLYFAAGLPLQLLTLVPLAALERGLRFNMVARAELEGLILYYCVAVTLAARNWGASGIVVGWWVQILWVALRVHRAAALPIRFAWPSHSARQALRFGLPYASSIWTYQLRDLVNPLLVGRWAGPEGVAVIALTVRLVDAAAFVKGAAWRLALPAFSRLQGDAARMAVAVRDGMRLQVLLVGLSMLLLATVGVPVVIRVFGPQWAAMAQVLALVAAATLCNSAFNLHSAALYALGRTGVVWGFHMVHVLLFVGTAALLVPRYGIAGYGFAELVAFPAYVLVWRALRGALRQTGQDFELWLAATLVSATALVLVTPFAAALALLPFLHPQARSLVRNVVGMLRAALEVRSA
jgi:O-antigen/teichoic acid export membrane protein